MRRPLPATARRPDLNAFGGSRAGPRPRPTLRVDFAAYLAGVALPVLIGIPVVPQIEQRTSGGELGLLALAWSVLTFINNFDFGVGRTMGRLAAVRLGPAGSSREDRRLQACVLLQCAIGLALGAAVVGAGQQIAGRSGIEFSPGPLLLVGACTPLVILGSGARYVLEARGGVTSSGLIGGGLTAAQFLIPLIGLTLGWPIQAVVVALFVSRGVAGLAVFVSTCTQELSGLLTRPRDAVSALPSVLGDAWWLSVATTFGLVALYGDKYIGATSADLAALAPYTVVFEFVARLTIVPAVLARVVFPRLSGVGPNDSQMTALVDTTRRVSLAFSLACLAAAATCRPAIRAWLGPEMASDSGRYAQLLLVGIALSGFAYISQAAFVAAGEPRIPALVVAATLPPFLIGSWYLARAGEIEALVVLWSVRNLIEGGAVTLLYERAHGGRAPRSIRDLGMILVGAAAVVMLA